jgi:hypothetical protein
MPMNLAKRTSHGGEEKASRSVEACGLRCFANDHREICCLDVSICLYARDGTHLAIFNLSLTTANISSSSWPPTKATRPSPGCTSTGTTYPGRATQRLPPPQLVAAPLGALAPLRRFCHLRPICLLLNTHLAACATLHRCDREYQPAAPGNIPTYVRTWSKLPRIRITRNARCQRDTNPVIRCTAENAPCSYACAQQGCHR